MSGADYEDDSEDRGGTHPERAARYWKKAARAYKQACSADTAETKKLYMQIAMAWATLASEMERMPLPAWGAGNLHTDRSH
jgi:hypothetical protein